MEAKTINPCSLEQELAQKAGELASQHYVREKQMVALTLKGIAESVESKVSEISTLMEATKGRCMDKLREIAVKEILRSSDGLLWNGDYDEKLRGSQHVSCYTGSHWENVESQQWKDFVSLCAERCGISESLRMNPKFMNPLYESVAFNVAKYRRLEVPRGEVWLNMRNGTLVLRKDGSVILNEHCKENLFRYTLDYAYDPQAECPQWDKFLDRVLPELEDQQVLAEYVGYCLMPDHELEKLLWLIGPGGNGKSVTLEVIEGLLGSVNVSYLSLTDLTDDDTKRASFEHKMVNISFETGRNINPNVMKQLTSGEPVTIELKYVNPRQMTEYGKIITSTNQLPRAENTPAFFRRIIILPFTTTITEEEKDINLADKLKEELPGILNWVLRALPGLMSRKAFSMCRNSVRAMEEYKLESDNVNLFLHEMLEVSDDFTNGMDLYRAYQNYCKASGLLALGRSNFYKRLDSLTNSRDDYGNVTRFKLKLLEQ